jgi:cysteine desulfurase
MSTSPVYLDHAATTPVRPRARAALLAWVDAANASAIHRAGQDARVGVEQARETIATTLGCEPT